LVDTGDLKSPDRKIVPVQVRPRAPLQISFNVKKYHTLSEVTVLAGLKSILIYDGVVIYLSHKVAVQSH
jgi:hypothetical protein